MKDPKKWREYMKRYRAENKDLVNSISQKYRENNPEKRQESSKRYYEKNKERIGEYLTEYRKNNPDKYRQYNRNNYQKNKEYYANKRREALAKRMKWINDLKNEKGCKVCGGKDDLEFHHRDKSTKIMNVSRMVTCLVKMDILLAEIEKCDILCSKCHDSIHIKERILIEEERIESEKRAKEYHQNYREEHREKAKNYGQQYRQENKDKIRERINDWRNRNRDKVNEQSRRYKARHKEEIKERNKIYREKNIDRFKEKNKQDFQDKKQYYYQKRKEYMAALVKWVNDIKQERGCKICGTKDSIGFYYRDPHETAPNVSKLVNAMKNRNIILEAIKKCDIYCNSCYSKNIRN
jgi:hypothetical protein